MNNIASHGPRRLGARHGAAWRSGVHGDNPWDCRANDVLQQWWGCGNVPFTKVMMLDDVVVNGKMVDDYGSL